MLILNSSISAKCSEIGISNLKLESGGLLVSECGRKRKRITSALPKRLTLKEREIVLDKVVSFLETFAEELKELDKIDADISSSVIAKNNKVIVGKKGVVYYAETRTSAYGGVITVKFTPAEFIDNKSIANTSTIIQDGYIYDVEAVAEFEIETKPSYNETLMPAPVLSKCPLKYIADAVDLAKTLPNMKELHINNTNRIKELENRRNAIFSSFETGIVC